MSGDTSHKQARQFGGGKFAMTDGNEFRDFYSILQVKQNCSAKTLETAYRRLAKMYHPDHPETTDITKFNDVVEAYRILRNPDQRSEYDALYNENRKENVFRFPFDDSFENDEMSAINDADAHSKILLALYRRRRENAQDAGVVRFYVQKMLDCSDENFDFHIWYLKSKGLIETTEHGTLAITIEGVDHVISMSRTAMAEKLLLTQSSDQQGAARS